MQILPRSAKRAVAVLLLAMAVAKASADPLETIAPGLTASGLCPLVNSNPQAVIDAIAAGASQAYDQGTRDQYAAALGAAVVAANDNNCINQVFEAVNQAIIKGGFKVEAVVGKALALGVASGTAGAGDVLAKATAVVICKGGESASACARAWAQAIQIDPTNGCAVLKTAYVYAKAFCSEGTAKTQVQSTYFMQPLGQCGQSDFMTGGNSGNNGAGGQTVYVSYPGGWVHKGPAVKTVTYPSKSVVLGKGGHVTFPFGSVTWGRKMLAAQNAANAA